MGPQNLDDDDLIAAWGVITAAVTHAQNRVLAGVEDAGVHPQWFAVLHLLLKADEHRLPMSRIAADLSMTSGGFTKLADRMARDGLIDRRNSAGDRRVIFAALTELGLQTARQTEQLYLGGLREHVHDILGGDGVSTLADIMATLAASTGEVPSPEIVIEDGRDPSLPERRGRDHASGE